MHTLSVLSVDRALTTLGRRTKKKYTLQVDHTPSFAQIIDDNGEILDCDVHAPNLVNRLHARVLDLELAEMFNFLK